jgi:hypothetical protein
MDAIPFHFDTHGGFGEVQGLARLDELGLELQFSTRDAVFGVIKTEQKSLRIPLEQLLSVRFSAGFLWLMPVIQLRVRDLSVLKDLPESGEGRVKLRVRFRDRHDARAFVKDLEGMRAHVRILQLDRALDRMTSPLPPVAPPQAAPSAAPKAQETAPPRPPMSEG